MTRRARSCCLRLLRSRAAACIRSTAAAAAGPSRRRCARSRSAPIEGQVGLAGAQRAGRPARRDRHGDAAYRLEVELDDNITGFGIRGDHAATRERRTLRARYQLVSIASGTVLLDATAGSDAGIDVVSSEYATVAAEQTALERLADIVADQIVARLALYARAGRRRSEGIKVVDRPGGRPARPPTSASTCSTVPTRRSRARLAERLIEALAARAKLRAFGRGASRPTRAARRRGRGDEPVRRNARGLGRTRRRRDRGRRRGTARSDRGREPGGRDCRSAAQELGVAQARRGWRPKPWRSRPTRPRAPTPSGW